MDNDYRKKLRNHLKKSFRTNKLEGTLLSPKTDFVHALITPSSLNVQSSTSRTIQALLDATYSSSSEPLLHDATQLEDTIDLHQDSQHCLISKHKGTISAACTTVYSEDDNKKSTIGGEINGNPVQPHTSTRSVVSHTNSTFSKSSSFKRRTSRDLRNMVKNQCKMAESLNMGDGASASNVLPPSMIFWKSKRKFSSSVDLQSDILNRSDPSSLNLCGRRRDLPVFDTFYDASSLSVREKENKAHSEYILSLPTGEEPARGNVEIIREQFTPVVSEMERVYVQSVAATADLIKKLESLPDSIDKALAKRQNPQ